jgi:hypothetical protein
VRGGEYFGTRVVWSGQDVSKCVYRFCGVQWVFSGARCMKGHLCQRWICRWIVNGSDHEPSSTTLQDLKRGTCL